MSTIFHCFGFETSFSCGFAALKCNWLFSCPELPASSGKRRWLTKFIGVIYSYFGVSFVFYLFSLLLLLFRFPDAFEISNFFDFIKQLIGFFVSQPLQSKILEWLNETFPFRPSVGCTRFSSFFVRSTALSECIHYHEIRYFPFKYLEGN